MNEWQETETRVHPLRVNGKPTTQEEIRANADKTLGLWPKVTSVEGGMAETILALLDLLEANQDLIKFLTTGNVSDPDDGGLCYEGAAS
jgi:hypothetical protein